jgi:hypothetical protein
VRSIGIISIRGELGLFCFLAMYTKRPSVSLEKFLWLPMKMISLGDNIIADGISLCLFHGMGNPKGINQILWERGLLNLDISCVTKQDPNNEGKLQDSIFLLECPGLVNEKTCLMYSGNVLVLKQTTQQNVIQR